MSHKTSVNLGTPFSQEHLFIAASVFPKDPIAKDHQYCYFLTQLEIGDTETS